MVGGKRRRSARRQVLGSHQKCWLYGRHAVLEALRAGRWRPLEVWLAGDLEAEVRDEATAITTRLEIPVVESDTDTLTKGCGGLAHQGLLARMPPFPYVDAERLLDAAVAPAFFVILDGIQDPFNFGAILRSADVFGAGGVIVPAVSQSEVTVQVARSSAGAVNHVPIAQVGELLDVLSRLRARGVRSIAASGDAELAVSECDLRDACALVIGNEGAGVRDEVLAACDLRVKIPQMGHIDSLNAAVAAGILCYEVQRQRQVARNVT